MRLFPVVVAFDITKKVTLPLHRQNHRVIRSLCCHFHRDYCQCLKLYTRILVDMHAREMKCIPWSGTNGSFDVPSFWPTPWVCPSSIDSSSASTELSLLVSSPEIVFNCDLVVVNQLHNFNQKWYGRYHLVVVTVSARTKSCTHN